MDNSFDVSLLRNVQAADGKSSVSKEFVGLRKKRERNRAKRDTPSGYPQKAAKRYNGDPPEEGEEREHIDITI